MRFDWPFTTLARKLKMTKANGDLQAVILVGPGDRLYPLVDEAALNNPNSASTLAVGLTGISQASISASSSGPSASASGTVNSCPSTGGNPASTTATTNSTISTNPLSSGTGSSSSNYSKAMLPICNRPLIYYPLTWLIQSGIGEIIIIVLQKFHSKIANYVNRQYEYAEGTKIEVVPVVENAGSFAALMSVRHRLKGDFLVLSCDLITDAPLSKIADLHRSKSALMTCLLSGPQASGLISSSAASGAQGSTSANAADASSLTDPRYLASLAGEELLVALDMSTMTVATDSIHSVSSCDLIYCAPQADSLDESNTHLPIKMSTLFRYPKMRLRTDLLDPHCYLFGLGIFDMIEEIIKVANGKQIGDAGEESEIEDGELTIPASLFSLREDVIPKVLRRVHRFRSSEGISSRPSSTFAVIVDSGNYCLRANTLPALLESTRQLMKSSSFSTLVTAQKVASSAEISPRSQVGNDSLFGESSRLGERSSIKKSVVGSNCCIGNNVKVVNCIVMDGAVIEDGCKLDGCIIGPKAILREKCQLKDCDVAGGFELERERTAKAETFGSNRELVEDLY